MFVIVNKLTSVKSRRSTIILMRLQSPFILWKNITEMYVTIKTYLLYVTQEVEKAI